MGRSTQVIAILREQKSPPERRAPLSPKQVGELLSRKPNLAVWVQPCPHRCFADAEYAQAGAQIVEDISEADFLLGIKERKPDELLPGKHYLVFSHTIKLQPANQAFLQTVLARGCRLTDYETITDPAGSRLVAFGYFAGIVGALHALRMAGRRTGRFDIKAPKDYATLDEALQELDKKDLSGLRLVLTGHGRVSAGAAQVLIAAGFSKMHPHAFLTEEAQSSNQPPVFTQLSSADLYHPADGSAWMSSDHFYKHPTEYVSRFAPYLHSADGLITGAYWGPGYPRLFEMELLKQASLRLKFIADVSCDIQGAVPCTHRPTTIEQPYFDIDLGIGEEKPAFSHPDHLTMMTIDNLPSEMPAEATRHFGRQLLDNFMDDLLADGPITQHATLAQNGALLPVYSYLAGYAGVEAASF